MYTVHKTYTQGLDINTIIHLRCGDIEYACGLNSFHVSVEAYTRILYTEAYYKFCTNGPLLWNSFYGR